MPYELTGPDFEELQARLQKTYPWIGEKGTRQFAHVFNEAYHAHGGDEQRAFSTAYGVLKRQGYKRRDEIGEKDRGRVDEGVLGEVHLATGFGQEVVPTIDLAEYTPIKDARGRARHAAVVGFGLGVVVGAFVTWKWGKG